MKSAIERFEITRLLARTSSGYSALVSDLETGESDLVLKVIPRGKLDRAGLARFYSWCSTQGHRHLDGPLIAGISTDDELYWVRPYYEATPAAGVLRDHLTSLISAVHFLHCAGFLHKRIHPRNVLFAGSTLLLVDAAPWATSELVPGAPPDTHFTAPEVLEGGTPSEASDLYALGATLFYMATGKTLFEDADAAALRVKYRIAVLPRLQTLDRTADPLAAAIDGLLSRQPASRRLALESIQAQLPENPLDGKKTPLIGRLPIWTTLEAMAFQAKGSTTVWIEGAHGLGKTRLLDELALHSPFYPVVRVATRCTSEESELGPLRKVVLDLLRRRQRDGNPPTQNPSNRVLEAFLLEGEVGRLDSAALEYLITNLVGLLARWSQDSRLLLAFDDIQHARPAMAAFLMQLCMRHGEFNGTIVLAGCGCPAGVPVLTRLVREQLLENHCAFTLLPLSADESLRLVRHLGAKTVADSVLRNAGGNPLLLCDGTGDNTRRWYHKAMSRMPEESGPTLGFLAVLQQPMPMETLQQCLALTPDGLNTVLAWGRENDLIRREGCGVALAHGQAIAATLVRSLAPQERIRLHGVALDVLAGTGQSVEHLALHALRARRYHESLELCLSTAVSLRQLGQFLKALRFYRAGARVAAVLGKAIPAIRRFEMAECYSRLGRHERAAAIYQQLWSAGLADDPSLGPVLVTRLTSLGNGITPAGKVELYDRVLRSLPRESSIRARVALQIVQTLVGTGRIAEAEQALERARTIAADAGTERESFVAADALIHIGHGRFRHAAQLLRGVPVSNSPFGIRVIANLALCHEHSGRFTAAAECLERVQSWARSSGDAFGQIMSRNNLASVLRKQGEFVRSAGECAAALREMERLGSMDRSFPVAKYAVVHADNALLAAERGHYSEALRCLEEVGYSRERAAMDEAFIAICRCDIFLRVGDRTEAQAALEHFRQGELATNGFFEVEAALLELDLTGPAVSIDRLSQLLSRAAAQSSLHQKCRLLLALAEAQRGRDLTQTRMKADAAYVIARNNGYRPLEARALLLAGLSRDATEGERLLRRALALAAKMGLPELVAEASYWIARAQADRGMVANAKEHVVRSVSTTTSLAMQVPPRCHVEYLSRDWRAEARRLLHQCGVPSMDGVWGRAGTDSDSHFRALYRLSTVASSARSLDEFMERLVKDVYSAVRHPLVVVCRTGQRILWKATHVTLTGHLRKHVLTLADGATRRQPYYQNSGHSTVAWVPFEGGNCFGGIYVACQEGTSISEREIELFEILHMVASQAIRRIHVRSTRFTQEEPQVEFAGIVGASPQVMTLRTHITTAATSDASALIEGETGTGKELVARAIHNLGRRAAFPFIPVDCGTMTEGLIESELFGARRGAYTGSIADRPGLFEAAHRGTLFLDEISNLSLALQARLLRVLQEKEVRRLGESRARPVDVRVIAASNRSLKTLVNDGLFRRDLLYRINVLAITVPPLRDREGDIALLARHFLGRLNSREKVSKVLSPTALWTLTAYSFPGNVRELQNALERSFFMSEGNDMETILLDSEVVAESSGDVAAWFRDLAEGRRDFWQGVHDPYKRRDIPRDKVLALVDLGLRATRGSYKGLAEVFHVQPADYRRMMDFLRRSKCLLDFRPYRARLVRHD